MCLLPGLNRERLIEELLVEILLDVMDQNNSFALVVKLRPAGSPHHLQDIYTHGTTLKITAFYTACMIQQLYCNSFQIV